MRASRQDWENLMAAWKQPPDRSTEESKPTMSLVDLVSQRHRLVSCGGKLYSVTVEEQVLTK